LKYMNFVFKHGIRVDKGTQMVGSYGPQMEAYEFACPEDIAPTGFAARGKYTAKGRLLDDDGNIYVDFEYAFEIKKDW